MTPPVRSFGRAFVAAVVLGAGAASGGGSPPRADLAWVEGIVRRGGVPTAARLEVRPVPGGSTSPYGVRDPDGEDEDADPAQDGIAEAPPIERVAADEQGRYRLQGLPVGRYQVRATDGSGARAFVGLLVTGGFGQVVDVAIAPGTRTLRGRISWVDGPFRGTVVLSQPREGRRATPWLDGADAVETDADGRFEAGGLVPGRVDVSAVAPGRMRVTWGRRELPATGELRLALGGPLRERTGRVTTLGGEPIADAPLICRTVSDDGTEVAAVSRTDAEGRFRALGAPGPLRLHVRAPAFLPDVTLDDAGDGVARLARAPVVRGVVRRKEGGTPVEGAWVHVTVVPGDRGERTSSGRTDAAGRYEIVSRQVGEARVVVAGTDWLGMDPVVEGRRLDEEGVYDVDLEAVPAARLTGHVVSDDGRAIVGGRVEVRIDDEDENRSAKQAVADRARPAATDAEGGFHVEGLWPDTAVRVGVDAPFHRPSGIGARSGSSVGITLERRTPIVGRVLLPAGARPSDVWLRATAAPPRSADHEAKPTPGPEFLPLGSLDVRCDGSFRIRPERPEPHALTAGAWVHGIAYEGTALGEPGQADVVLTLARSERTPRAWLFRVLDPGGRPVPAGEAIVQQRGPGYSGRRWLSFEDGEVHFWSDRSNDEVSVLLTGFRDLAGRPLAYALAETEAFPPGVHDVRLQPGRVIRGRARTPDGTPVRHAAVSARPVTDAPGDRGEDAWDETDREGRFVLRNLALRDYAIAVRAPPGMSPVPPVPAPVALEEVDVTVVPLVRVRLEVRTKDGQAVEGARVLVWSPTGRGALACGALDLRTGADGGVTLPPLPPREGFDVRVDPDREDALPIDLPGWRPEPTVVHLPPAEVLRGAVRDASDRPVAEATVWVRPIPGGAGGPSPGRSWHRIRDGFVLGALTERDGGFSIGRLAPGEVELFATIMADNGRTAEGPSLKASTAAHDVVLRIPLR